MIGIDPPSLNAGRLPTLHYVDGGEHGAHS